MFACEQVLFGFVSHCLSQLMSAVACRTEASSKRPKDIMDGCGSPGLSEVRNAFCVIFLSDIAYDITELSQEQID